jgi:hypothetical protein
MAVRCEMLIKARKPVGISNAVVMVECEAIEK